jgi:hypothetical protein
MIALSDVQDQFRMLKEYVPELYKSPHDLEQRIHVDIFADACF